MDVHTYRTTVEWSGTTSTGYEGYERGHRASVDPAPPLELSSDPAFRGDPTSLNPEQLLVLAASSCQLLSFLAVAARARLDVVRYVDHAMGEMPDRPAGVPSAERVPMSIERIVLRPEIELRGAPPIDRVQRLVRIAHDECYIANSLRTEIVVEADIRVSR